MATYEPPKKNTAFITYVDLVSRAAPYGFQVNPTLAAGDVQVSIDGGAYANLTTLPAVTPAGSSTVKISLSAAEMNGDNVHVLFKDQAGAEWNDFSMNLQTTANQIDDLATAAAVAALPTANQNADALLDRADAIETGWTVRKAWRIALAAMAGKSSGHSTDAPVYRSVTDAKDRITATTSADGRSAVTLDAT
jgi:hypothetical protein